MVASALREKKKEKGNRLIELRVTVFIDISEFLGLRVCESKQLDLHSLYCYIMLLQNVNIDSIIDNIVIFVFINLFIFIFLSIFQYNC